MSLQMSTGTADCADAAGLARFWADALGRAVAPGASAASAAFAAVGGPRRPADPPALQVPEPRAGENRWHLDLEAAGPGQEVERLRALGATVLREVSEEGVSWVVLADPERDEFCVAVPHSVSP